MKETNTILGEFDCDGGDECKSNLAGSAASVRDVKPESDVHSILPNHRSPLEYKVYHVVNILQLTVSDDCLLTARVEKLSRGFPKPRGRALKPSPPARLLLTGGFTLKPRGRAPASLVCCAIAHLVWHGGVSRNPYDERHSHTRPGLSFVLFGYIPTIVYFVVTIQFVPHPVFEKCLAASLIHHS